MEIDKEREKWPILLQSLCNRHVHFVAAAAVQSPSRVWLSATPMDCSVPSFSVLHYLPEFAQTHVHWVGDAIQPSHPLLSPSPPAFNRSQHQGLFQWVSSSSQVAKVLELQLQHQFSKECSGLISFRMDWLDLLAVQGCSPTPQFESVNSSVFSLLYGPTLTLSSFPWPLEKP